MHIAILQTTPADVAAYLHQIETQVPKELVARAEIVDTSADDGEGLPRVVAQIADVSEIEFAAIEAAIAHCAAPEFDLMRDRALPAALAASADDAPAPPDVPWLEAAGPAAPIPPETAALLARLFAPRDTAGTEPSGFPEDSYTGNHKLAYAHIVKALGVAPNKDHSRTVTEAQIRAIRKPLRVKKAVWTEIVDHLCQVVRYLSHADKWWGPTGLFHSVYADVTTFNLLFIDTVVDTYKLELKPSAMVTLVLDTAMGLTFKAIAAIPDVGPIMSEIASLLWKAAKSGAGGDGKVRAKVAAIKAGIAPYYNASLLALGQTHANTCTDWETLHAFGAQIENGTLVWPSETSALRRPHAYGFQYESLRKLLHVASDANSKLPFKVWGIARALGHETKERSKPKWDKSRKRWMTKTRTRCVGYPEYDELFIGLYRHPPDWDVHTEQFQELSEKMFGNSASAENPGLALPPKFLADPATRKKLGWVVNSA